MKTHQSDKKNCIKGHLRILGFGALESLVRPLIQRSSEEWENIAFLCTHALLHPSNLGVPAGEIEDLHLPRAAENWC